MAIEHGHMFSPTSHRRPLTSSGSGLKDPQPFKQLVVMVVGFLAVFIYPYEHGWNFYLKERKRSERKKEQKKKRKNRIALTDAWLASEK